MKVIVERSKWLRGEGSGVSFLRRGRDNKMCCLGFLGLACGIPAEQMKDQTSPRSSLDLAKAPWANGLLEFMDPVSFRLGPDPRAFLTPLAGDMMEINDDRDIIDEVRENSLKDLFSKIDVEIVFVD